MSIFALSWQAAAGVGPVFGGFLNDTFSPQAIWLGGGVFGLLATLNFVRLAVREKAVPD
jgi:MFS family permease